MKRLLIILGFSSALIAAIISATTYSNFAITPILIAFVCGTIVLWLTKNDKRRSKTIQYLFLLTIMALSLTIYKNVISEVKPNDLEPLEKSEENQQNREQ